MDYGFATLSSFQPSKCLLHAIGIPTPVAAGPTGFWPFFFLLRIQLVFCHTFLWTAYSYSCHWIEPNWGWKWQWANLVVDMISITLCFFSAFFFIEGGSALYVLGRECSGGDGDTRLCITNQTKAKKRKPHKRHAPRSTALTLVRYLIVTWEGWSARGGWYSVVLFFFLSPSSCRHFFLRMYCHSLSTSRVLVLWSIEPNAIQKLVSWLTSTRFIILPIPTSLSFSPLNDSLWHS